MPSFKELSFGQQRRLFILGSLGAAAGLAGCAVARKLADELATEETDCAHYKGLEAYGCLNNDEVIGASDARIIQEQLSHQLGRSVREVEYLKEGSIFTVPEGGLPVYYFPDTTLGTNKSPKFQLTRMQEGESFTPSYLVTILTPDGGVCQWYAFFSRREENIPEIFQFDLYLEEGGQVSFLGNEEGQEQFGQTLVDNANLAIGYQYAFRKITVALFVPAFSCPEYLA